MPLRSAALVMTLFFMCRMFRPWVCAASSLTSRNSSAALALTYSHTARDEPSPSYVKKGSSNTSLRGNRPGV